MDSANETKANAQKAYDDSKRLVDEKADLIKDYEEAYKIAQQQVESAQQRVDKAQKIMILVNLKSRLLRKDWMSLKKQIKN